MWLALDYPELLQGPQEERGAALYLPGLLLKWAKRTNDLVEPRKRS